MSPDILDVIIVGGGPAGLSAALVLARACRRIAVIDSGRPRNSAACELHGFLTRDGISPRELRELGRRDVARYGIDVIEDVVATAAKRGGHDEPFPTLFQVETQQGRSFVARKLLLAAGMRDDVPDVPGLRECYGVSVHHCPYCDGWERRGARLVAFGADARSAAGMGLLLRGWSNDVTVLTNGMSLDGEMRMRLERQQVRSFENPIQHVVRDGPQITGIQLTGGVAIPADALFFNSRQEPACDLARRLGVEAASNFAGRTNGKQQTNVPGLFMAGDADGDVEFAIVAAAEGATAAVAINRELHEEDRL